MTVSRPGRVNPLVVLVALALIPALVLWSVWQWADARAAIADEGVPATATSVPPPAAFAAMATPLLSYRRAAVTLSRDLNVGAFESAVQPLLAAVDDRSCVAVSLDGRLIGERNAELPVIPASNQKILVAAVALDVLGADFRYTTRVVGPAPRAGVVDGDLYLVGGGDPLLSGEWYPDSDLDRFPVFNITSLDSLARDLAAAGVTQVNGAVRGDGSRYDDEFFAPGWGAGVAGLEAGPYDALLVNDARVRGDDQRASDPNEGAAREFVALLGEQGITVTGGPGVGVAPVDLAEIASVESQPLPAVIAEMLTNSDNNTAELMVKEIGLAASGAGTRIAGLEAMADAITSWDVDASGIVLADGSGLSLDNRLTCRALLGVLQHVGAEGPVSDGLAVAGRTGTLTDVFVDTAVEGRLRAKTGTLNNFPIDEDPPAVKALAGFLPIDGGSAIEFALLLNGPTISDQSEYRPVWNELVVALGSYPAVAGPAELGPR